MYDKDLKSGVTFQKGTSMKTVYRLKTEDRSAYVKDFHEYTVEYGKRDAAVTSTLPKVSVYYHSGLKICVIRQNPMRVIRES